MWKSVLAGTTALAIAGGSLVYAQQGPAGPRADGPRWRPTAEDVSAFGEARIAAMKAGLARATAYDPDVVACVHADGQYSPEALPSLLETMARRGLDLVQGSRIAAGTALAGGMPLYKYVANAALNRLENLTFGLGMTDYHSGYLLYGRRVLHRVPFARLSNSFDFDLEVIASARAAGLAVAEAAIPTHYGDEVSHLRPIQYGLRVLRVLWRFQRGHYDPA